MRNMLRTIGFILLISLVGNRVLAQRSGNAAADHWVDSVFKTLSKKQKIAQLDLKKSQLPKEFGHLAEEIYTAVRMDELLVSLLDVALKITNTECGSIMIIDKDKEELAVKVSRGLDEGKMKSRKIKMGEGISGLAAQENSTFFISTALWWMKSSRGNWKNRLPRPPNPAQSCCLTYLKVYSPIIVPH